MCRDHIIAHNSTLFIIKTISYLYIYSFIHSFIYLFTYVFVCLFIYLSIYLFMHIKWPHQMTPTLNHLVINAALASHIGYPLSSLAPDSQQCLTLQVSGWRYNTDIKHTCGWRVGRRGRMRGRRGSSSYCFRYFVLESTIYCLRYSQYNSINSLLNSYCTVLS